MYCTKCGAKKVKEFANEWDDVTGKKNYNLICPVNPCDHDGHDWNVLVPRGFWENLQYLLVRTAICRRCGTWYE